MSKGKRLSAVFPGEPVRKVWWYAPAVLPPVVQTADYTLAVWRRYGLDAQKTAAGDVGRWQDAILYADPRPQLHILTTEAFARYEWGDSRDRLEQVRYLADLSRRPNIRIRMQQFIDGPAVPLHPAAAVWFETGSSLFTAGGEITDPGIVDNYITAFEQSCDGALTTEDTTRMLDNLAGEG